MPQLKEAGRYRARLLDWKVGETKSKLPQFEVMFQVYQYWDGAASDWKGYTISENEIRGFFILVKKDGNLNSFAIKALSEALGWSGNSLKALAQAERYPDVQITCEFEPDLQGNHRLRVKFINELNSQPRRLGMKPDALDDLDKKYGRGLQAIRQERQGREADGEGLSFPEEKTVTRSEEESQEEVENESIPF